MYHEIAPHRFDNTFRPEAAPHAEDVVMAFDGRGLLLRSARDGSLTLPTVDCLGVWEAAELRYLFSIDGTRYFLWMGAEPAQADGFSYINLYHVQRDGARILCTAAMNAFHIYGWLQENRFCGRCGEGIKNMKHEFTAVILQNGDMDAGYIVVPLDIKAIYGKGRMAVHATFDGEPYDGQVVKMGTPDYILGVRKDIRKKLGKSFGDEIAVTLAPR